MNICKSCCEEKCELFLSCESIKNTRGMGICDSCGRHVMHHITCYKFKPKIYQVRPSRTQYYLDIALAIAQRGTCLRRNFGAIIVQNDVIVATGYTGAPRGWKNCCDIGVCKREELNIPRGYCYNLCKSVHAEMNAIINASKEEMNGAIMYVNGFEVKTREKVKKMVPCELCKRLIINAGIKEVITPDNHYHVKNWISNENIDFYSREEEIPDEECCSM